ncbi:MAG TPA: glycerophosphodiester phosphodiesterase family protein [Candidatus Hydrogenedentes bacterium]|nr:glycerophosphodiester phosphodiesterase family protein [Candidatus Hydrogenedentota bacterium]
MLILLSALILCVLTARVRAEAGIRFQAHRGGLGEYPENTMAAFQASWRLGAIPELDLRTTKDDVFICLHDATLARTTDADEAMKDVDVSALTLDEIRRWDAGVRFAGAYAGERVPTLEEVLASMQGHPEREIYLDFKTADLDKLSSLINRYGVMGQIIYCHNRQETCIAIAERLPGLRTMLWIGGRPDEILAAFDAAAANGFNRLAQVQLHLHPEEGVDPVAYLLPADRITAALRTTQRHGIDLEVLPFRFDEASIHHLLDLGVRWYATDHPNRFAACVRNWTGNDTVYIQAHRGAVEEAPENTMAAFQHAWTVEGAVPEMDIRTTSDGVLICLHDATPGRTTDAPASFKDTDVSKIAFDQLRQWDAGSSFDERFAGERVAALREVFEEMRGRPERQVYLDLKGVDLDQLKALIDEYGVGGQVIFVAGTQETCIAAQERFPGARTMTWLSGMPFQIKQGFDKLAQSDFKGVSQLQFHLQTKRRDTEIEYVFDEAYLREVKQRLDAANVALQLRPFDFDAASLRKLLDLGVRWFVADAPAAFAEAVREARALPAE